MSDKKLWAVMQAGYQYINVGSTCDLFHTEEEAIKHAKALVSSSYDSSLWYVVKYVDKVYVDSNPIKVETLK